MSTHIASRMKDQDLFRELRECLAYDPDDEPYERREKRRRANELINEIETRLIGRYGVPQSKNQTVPKSQE